MRSSNQANWGHLYEFLERVCARPAPFERCTTRELWTDAHTSRMMLRNHLDASHDAASRRGEFIEDSTRWIASRFGVGPGVRVADFGCGPGLYTTALARKGAQVTGIDFSERSLRHARETAQRNGLKINYINQDYLSFGSSERFHLILLITCDYCALSPANRAALLRRFGAILEPGGHLLFDVYSLNAFAARTENASFGPNQLDGFWADQRYYGFQNTFLYEEEKLALDKYTIVERERVREVYNWFQHFSPQSLAEELAQAGLRVESLWGDVAGAPFDANGAEFAIIASTAGTVAPWTEAPCSTPS